MKLGRVDHWIEPVCTKIHEFIIEKKEEITEKK